MKCAYLGAEGKTLKVKTWHSLKKKLVHYLYIESPSWIPTYDVSTQTSQFAYDTPSAVSPRQCFRKTYATVRGRCRTGIYTTEIP